MSKGGLVVVRFVKSNVDSPVSSVLQEAFEAIQEIPAESVWFTEEECFTVTTKERTFIYIFEDFGGAAFEHINSTGNRIYGPVCVLHCLKKATALPKAPHPIFSLSMEGLIVSCTSLDKERKEQIHKYVEWMSGEVDKNFHQNVTHLVAGEVGSKKYRVAAKLKKKIMSPEWVEKVWLAARSSFVRGDDPAYDKHRCPIFKGCVITVSGLESSERGKIKDIVTKQGGKYSGEMKFNECTHLIVNMPRGQKYEFAKQWKIHIVSPKWLYNSLDAGYCLEESDYPVGQKLARVLDNTEHPTSTPTSTKDGAPCEMPDVSVISMSRINETNMTTLTNTSTCSLRNQSVYSDNKTESGTSLANKLNSLDITRPKNNMFLDGCKIFLTGFKGQILEKLKNLINIGGGTRLNQINEHISHIVMGERLESFVRELEQKSFRPYVVSVDWLIACYQSGETVSEESYCRLDLPSADADAPKFKSDKAQASKASKTTLSGYEVQGQVNLKHRTDQENKPPEGVDELLCQYLSGSTNKATMGESTLLRAAEMGEEAANDETLTSEPADNNQTVAAAPADQSVSTADDVGKQQMSTSDVDLTQDESENRLFKGKHFVILGFDAPNESEMSELISHYGGTVLPTTTRNVPDYAVVPVFGCSVVLEASNIVTNAWVQMCIEQEELLSLNSDPIFQPIPVMPGTVPLKGCVVSVSGYIGTERDAIIHMAAILGAVVQDYFVKKANAAKKLEANTHLVVKEAEGSKYNAAKKWKIPAVTKHWIIECAKQNKCLDENLFLVDQKPDHNATIVQNEAIGQRSDGIVEGTSSKNSVQEREKSTCRSDDVTLPTPAPTNGNKSHEEIDCNISLRNESISINRTQSEETPGCKNVDKEECPQIYQKTIKSPNTTSGLHNVDQMETVVTGRKSAVPKECASPSLCTPKPINDRVRQLVTETKSSPISQQHLSPSGQSSSPGQERSFHAKFDLTEAIAELQSPATPRMQNGTKLTHNKSLSLEEVFTYNLEIAVKNQSDAGRSTLCDGTPYSQRTRTAVVEVEQKPTGPLSGVIIVVSKKLSAQQSEYNNMAARLGADYRWTYNNSCTHFIFEGRLNDTNKEFRLARDQGKFIVSPHWLVMCQEQNCRVDETLFPHTFNPKLTLAVTPARSTRKSTRQQESKSSTEPHSGDKERKKTNFSSLDTTQSDEDMAQEAENVEDKERETNTQALVNDLKMLMAVTRTYSRGKRFSRRNDSFNKLTGQETTNSGERKKQDEASPTVSSAERRPSRLRSISSKPETQSEASQMIEVSWDDPAAREQQEKLAKDLVQDKESPDNCHNSSPDGSRDADHQNDDVPQVTHLSAPEAPRKADTEPAAIPEQTETPKEVDKEEHVDIPKLPFILMSGLGQQEREQYSALVEELGGIVLDSPEYDPKCSHLIVGQPARNEKFLSCLAAGKWVLYKSYLDDCKKFGRFVEEGPHEWGSAQTEFVLNGASAQVIKLAQAAHRWRQLLQAESSRLQGAFDGWKVMLLTEKRKQAGFKRLLEAGAGRVITDKYPYHDLDSITHAFIDVNKIRFQIDYEELTSSGIHCLKPEYIAAYLMDNPPPEPKQYYIQDVVPLLAQRDGDIRKRKASGHDRQDTNTLTKRSKR